MKKLRIASFRLALPALALALLAAGCSSGPKARPGSGSRATGPQASSAQTQPEQYGPPLSDDDNPPAVYGPQPVELKPVTLVFGPGMARAFAHAGALRALDENKIPIKAIYGMEMGSLMAALYATDSNINHFDWNLFRFTDDIFLAGHGLLSRFFGDEGASELGDAYKLARELRSVFGRQDISSAKIPLRIAIQKSGDSGPTLLRGGALPEALRVSLASPGFFGPGAFNGEPAIASSDAAGEAFLCAQARAENGSPVVLIDTGTTPSDPSAADLVIRPDLRGIGPADFSRKTDAAFLGKQAVEEKLPDLRKWVGGD